MVKMTEVTGPLTLSLATMKMRKKKKKKKKSKMTPVWVPLEVKAVKAVKAVTVQMLLAHHD
jgi:hypothetical protein